MKTVTHREWRNNSGEILRRVQAGESLQVSNNGRIAAVLVPPTADVLADLELRGQLRRATQTPATLRAIVRRPSDRPSAEIVADSRGRW